VAEPRDEHASAGYELAYIEARRALDEQASVVNDLRSRAGVLLAASAVTTSFFGKEALTDGSPGLAGWIGLASFVLAGVAVLCIL
jgi:hypothetical protein